MKKLIKVMTRIYNYLNPRIVEKQKEKESKLLYDALISLYIKCEGEHLVNKNSSAMCRGKNEYVYSGYFKIGYKTVPFTLTKHKIDSPTPFFIYSYHLETPFVHLCTYNREVLVTDIKNECDAKFLIELLKKGELNDRIKC